MSILPTQVQGSASSSSLESPPLNPNYSSHGSPPQSRSPLSLQSQIQPQSQQLSGISRVTSSISLIDFYYFSLTSFEASVFASLFNFFVCLCDSLGEYNSLCFTCLIESWIFHLNLFIYLCRGEKLNEI